MHHADHPKIGSRAQFEAGGEKMRLALKDRRSEGRMQDSGPVAFVSESDGGPSPPDYQQATDPSRQNNVR